MNFSIDALGLGIGLWMTKCVTNACKMFLEHLGNLDDFFHACFLHTVDPEVHILFSFRVRCAIKDGFEILT